MELLQKDEGLSLFKIILLIFADLIIGVIVYVITENISANIFVTNLMMPLIAFGLSLLIVFRKSLKHIQVSLHVSPKALGVFILLALSYMLVYDVTISILLADVPLPEFFYEFFSQIFSHPLLAFLSICIIAPITEEVIYRGIFLQRMKAKYGAKKALVFSSILFGIIHLNILQGINAFIIGFLLGAAYLITKNLLVPIIIHAFNNFIAFLLYYYPITFLTDNDFSIIQLVIGLSLAVFALYLLKKIISKNKIEDTSQETLVLYEEAEGL